MSVQIGELDPLWQEAVIVAALYTPPLDAGIGDLHRSPLMPAAKERLNPKQKAFHRITSKVTPAMNRTAAMTSRKSSRIIDRLKRSLMSISPFQNATHHSRERQS
jgi:hypothetical protein